MTRWLALLLGLLLAWPALADMYQDGSNAAPSFWAEAAPHVATNAALQAAATAAYPGGVTRDDYAAGRNAGPLLFMPQAGACAASSMVSDGGACVDAAGGGSWRAVQPDDGLSILQFGAAVDGVTSSLPAMQAAVNEARRLAAANTGLGVENANASPCVILPPAKGGNKGDYVIDGTWDINAGGPRQQLCIRWIKGARVLVNLTGAGAVGLQASSASSSVPDTRSWLTLYDPVVTYDARVLATDVGAVLLEANYQTFFNILGASRFFGARNNTLFRLGGCFNCYFDRVVLGQGGKNWQYRDATGITFATNTTAGVTTITASAPVFTAADVGHAISLMLAPGTGSNQRFVVASFVDATHVTTTRTDTVGFTTAIGVFDGVRGSMTSGSNTVTLDANVAVAADIGRWVYVLTAGNPIAGAGKATLRGRVSAVPAANQLTLVDEDGNPANAVRNVTGVYVVPSPAMEIFTPMASAATGNDNNNDVKFIGLTIEFFYGAGYVQKGGTNIRLVAPKIAAQNAAVGPTASTFNAIFDDVLDTQVLSADWMGNANNTLGQVYVSGLRSGLSLLDNRAFTHNDGGAVYKDDSGVGAIVTVGDWAIKSKAVDQRTVDNMFNQTGGGTLRLTGAYTAQELAYSYAIPGYTLVASAPGTTATATVTIATPGVVTIAGHGFSASTPTPVNFTTTGALPTGLAVGTNYWTVPASVTANTFQLASSIANAIAGTAIATSGSQSGVHTAVANSVLTSTSDLSILGVQLSPGTWSCAGISRFQLGGGTTQTLAINGIGSTLNNPGAASTGGGSTRFPGSTTVISAYPSGLSRQTVTAPTTVYFTVQSTFAGGTNAAGGRFDCTRTQ